MPVRKKTLDDKWPRSLINLC